MREHVKMIVWPRDSVEGLDGEGTIYRYTVVGMVVSDAPIPEFEGRNEILLDGASEGVLTSLSAVKSRMPKFRPGDAGTVLTGLKHL